MVWIYDPNDMDWDAARKQLEEDGRIPTRSRGVDVRDMFDPFGINKIFRDKIAGGSPQLKKAIKAHKRDVEKYKKLYKQLLDLGFTKK